MMVDRSDASFGAHIAAQGGASCPGCGQSGRRVGGVTLGALLAAPAGERAGALHGFRFCPTAHCDVVYFSERTGERFGTRELRVLVFQKSPDPSRLVCYCFGHCVAAVQDEVARTGQSQVPGQIAEKCREGLDRCAEENPQGTCCLGNVREVIKGAAATPSAAPNTPPRAGAAASSHPRRRASGPAPCPGRGCRAEPE